MEKPLDANEIYQAFLEFMEDGQSRHISEIEKGVAEILKLDSESRSQIHSKKRTVLGYKLAWVRTRAKNAGLIEQISRSYWRSVRR